jgi:hypothetical protein
VGRSVAASHTEGAILERFLSDTLWIEIKKLLKTAKQARAAVAYVHDVTHLPLKRNATLVCDASPASVAAGQTSVSVLRVLAKKGVHLYSAPGLHAKLVIADQIAVIGSGNASKSSISQRLIEAGLMTSAPSVLAGAHAFIEQLIQSPHTTSLDTAELSKLARIKVKRRPYGTGLAPKRATHSRTSLQEPSTWIVGLTDLDEDKYQSEERDVEKAERIIKTKFRRTDPSWMRFTGKSLFRRFAPAGSQVVVTTVESGRKRAVPYEVTAPTPILYRQDDKDGEWTRFYYDPDRSSHLKSIDWATFLSIAKKSGVKRQIKRFSTIRVAPAIMEEMIRIWPRTRRRR